MFQRRDSLDLVVYAKAKVQLEHKWNAGQTVEQAFGRLKHQEIVEVLKQGRNGLGQGPAPRMWSKFSRKERKHLEISYQIKSIVQNHQGKWTTREAVLNRTVTWTDRKIPQAWFSFQIRDT